MSRPTTARAADNPFEGLEEGEVETFLGPVARRHALLIGVNKYNHRSLTPLKYAVNDVRQLEKVLGAYSYRVQTLQDGNEAAKQPTRENVVRELRALVRKAKPEDLVLVHFSCHGKLKDGQTLLLLADTHWKQGAYAQALSVEEVKQLMLEGRSRRLVLLLDACQSGETGRAVPDKDVHTGFMRGAYLNAQGIVVLASCSDGQIANEPDSLGHGAFTYFVLEGLRKQAVDPTTQLVTTGRLATYVTEKLRARWQGEGDEIEPLQVPEMEVCDADLAIADRSQLTSPEALESIQVRRLEGHTDPVRDIVVLPDGSRWMTASQDRTVRLWDAKTGKPFGKPYVHPLVVTAAALSMDGTRIATVCANGQVRLWRVGDDEPADDFPLAVSVAFSSDSRYLALSTEFDVRLWDMKRSAAEVALLGHAGQVDCTEFSRDGKLLATSGYDGKVLLRDVRTKEVLWDLPVPGGPTGPFRRLAFSPDGRWLAAGGADPEVLERLVNVPRVWNTRTGACAFSLEGHSHEVTAVAFSPDGRRLLTGSRDGTARLWNASSGAPLTVFDQPSMDVTAAAFTADGNSILVGCVDGSVFIFDARESSTAKRKTRKPSNTASRRRKR